MSVSHSIAARPPRAAAFWFILITVALDMLALGIVIPVLPKLVEGMLAGDTAAAARVYGWFGFTWAFMQFVCSPLIGALSDRFGRRPIVLLSNFGLGVDYLVMALAPSVRWLLFGRMVSGMFAASISTAYAYIADVSPVDERAGRFGYLGAAFGLGFVLGPALGGYLGGIDHRLPFFVAAGLSLLNAGYGFFVLPESLPPERRDRFRWARANPLASLRLLRAHAELLGLAAVLGLMHLAHFALPSTMVLYAGYRYHWDEPTVGLFLGLVGVFAIIVQGGLVRPLVRRFGERRAALTGILFGALGFLVYALAPTGTVLMFGVPLMSLWGLSQPALQGLMSARLGPDEQGKLQGANTSLMGLAGLFGPLLFTTAFALAIGGGTSFQLPGAPMWLATLLLLAAFGLALRVAKPATLSGSA